MKSFSVGLLCFALTSTLLAQNDSPVIQIPLPRSIATATLLSGETLSQRQWATGLVYQVGYSENHALFTPTNGAIAPLNGSFVQLWTAGMTSAAPVVVTGPSNSTVSLSRNVFTNSWMPAVMTWTNNLIFKVPSGMGVGFWMPCGAAGAASGTVGYRFSYSPDGLTWNADAQLASHPVVASLTNVNYAGISAQPGVAYFQLTGITNTTGATLYLGPNLTLRAY